MLKFLKDKFSKEKSPEQSHTSDTADVPDTTHDNTTPPSTGLFAKLKAGLRRTREQFTTGLANLFLGKKVIDDELLEELETLLLVADVGVEATNQIIQHLTEQVKRRDLKDPSILAVSLKSYLESMLAPCESPLEIPETTKPFVILMIGINGAGKTTTIGKLTKQYQAAGKKVMLAAGDTFRAAAIEQLITWGKRNEVPVISQHTGADSASVIFDAFQAAQSRNFDVVIADTAGRLHTQDNLMAELKKITRVLKKLDEQAPHEIMLILDAGIGQNALKQAEKFHQEMGVTGLTVTKLDGTAKGGILFAIAKALQLPIRYIGVGEGIDDLKPFDAQNFVDALFETIEEESKEVDATT